MEPQEHTGQVDLVKVAPFEDNLVGEQVSPLGFPGPYTQHSFLGQSFLYYIVKIIRNKVKLIIILNIL